MDGQQSRPDTNKSSGYTRRIDVEANGTQNVGPGEEQASTTNHIEQAWEHAMFPGEGVPAHLRGKVEYLGVLKWIPYRKGKPLFVTGVRITHPDGRKVTWGTRRHRKQRIPHDTHNMNQDLTLSYRLFGWLNFWAFHKDINKAVTWWVANLFTIGSILFIISGVSNIIKPVAETQGQYSSYDWLVMWPTVVGAWAFFWPATYLYAVESSNLDWDKRLHEWESNGRKGKRPRYRWFLPFKADYIASWAAWIMFTGATAFNLGFLFECLQYDEPLNYNWTQQKWSMAFCTTYGGAAFTFASILFSIEATHSWWRGYFPLTMREVRSFSFWANATQLWGSIGFLISSACLYDQRLAVDQNWHGLMIELIFGYLIGGIWFELNGIFMFLELSNPDLE